jgi:hypothetical protein
MRIVRHLIALLLLLIISCAVNESSSYKLLVKSTNKKTNYNVVVEDYGYYYWASLYYGNSLSPLLSCFLWSSRNPIPESEMPAPFNGNPPISEKFASNKAVIEKFSKVSLKIIWNNDGEAAAILLCKEPVCMFDIPNKKGYSKSIKNSGPYGLPWDESIYKNKFGVARDILD